MTSVQGLLILSLDAIMSGRLFPGNVTRVKRWRVSMCVYVSLCIPRATNGRATTWPRESTPPPHVVGLLGNKPYDLIKVHTRPIEIPTKPVLKVKRSPSQLLVRYTVSATKAKKKKKKKKEKNQKLWDLARPLSRKRVSFQQTPPPTEHEKLENGLR